MLIFCVYRQFWKCWRGVRSRFLSGFWLAASLEDCCFLHS